MSLPDEICTCGLDETCCSTILLPPEQASSSSEPTLTLTVTTGSSTSYTTVTLPPPTTRPFPSSTQPSTTMFTVGVGTIFSSTPSSSGSSSSSVLALPPSSFASSRDNATAPASLPASPTSELSSTDRNGGGGAHMMSQAQMAGTIIATAAATLLLTGAIFFILLRRRRHLRDGSGSRWSASASASGDGNSVGNAVSFALDRDAVKIAEMADNSNYEGMAKGSSGALFCTRQSVVDGQSQSQIRDARGSQRTSAGTSQTVVSPWRQAHAHDQQRAGKGERSEVPGEWSLQIHELPAYTARGGRDKVVDVDSRVQGGATELDLRSRSTEVAEIQTESEDAQVGKAKIVMIGRRP